MLLASSCGLLVRRNRVVSFGRTARFFSIYHGGLPQEIKAGRVTHYNVLQVKEDATVREIREAYLRLVKLHHSDTSKNPDSPVIFVCIRDAHEILIDPLKRKEYDDHIAKAKHSCGPGPGHPSFTRAADVRGTGYDAKAAQEKEERWKRYNRYVRGERNDRDEPFIACKMLAALCVSGATIFGLCLFAQEFTTHFKGIGDEDDDCQEAVRDEVLVKAFYNPATDRWERVLSPFAVPAPSLLLAYYRDLDDEDFDENAIKIRLPKREFPVLEMPFSQTRRPSILYDPRSCKMVVFKD